MNISVKVKPMAHKESVEKNSDGSYVVFVKEPPQNGLANRAVEVALAKFLGVSRSSVRIIKGFTSKLKLVQIN